MAPVMTKVRPSRALPPAPMLALSFFFSSFGFSAVFAFGLSGWLLGFGAPFAAAVENLRRESGVSHVFILRLALRTHPHLHTSRLKSKTNVSSKPPSADVISWEPTAPLTKQRYSVSSPSHLTKMRSPSAGFLFGRSTAGSFTCDEQRATGVSIVVGRRFTPRTLSHLFFLLLLVLVLRLRVDFHGLDLLELLSRRRRGGGGGGGGSGSGGSSCLAGRLRRARVFTTLDGVFTPPCRPSQSFACSYLLLVVAHVDGDDVARNLGLLEPPSKDLVQGLRGGD